MAREDFEPQAARPVRLDFNSVPVDDNSLVLMDQTGFKPRRIGAGFYPLPQKERQNIVRKAVAESRIHLDKLSPEQAQSPYLSFTLDVGKPIGYDPFIKLNPTAQISNYFTEAASNDEQNKTLETSHDALFDIAESLQHPVHQDVVGLMAMEALEEFLTAQYIRVIMQRSPAADGSYKLLAIEPTSHEEHGLTALDDKMDKQVPSEKSILLVTPAVLADVQARRQSMATEFERTKKRSRLPQLPVVERWPGLKLKRQRHKALTGQTLSMGFHL